MALLATIVRLVEALGAIWATFAGSKLPLRRTCHALIVTWSTAGIATHVAPGAHAAIAVETSSTGGSTLPALQLQPAHTFRAVGLGRTFTARVNARIAHFVAFVRKSSFVAFGDAARILQDERMSA